VYKECTKNAMKQTQTNIYRRHLKPVGGKKRCKNPDHCSCPLWLYGYIAGERIRESLGTCRMDVAMDRQRRRERGEPPAALSEKQSAPKKHDLAEESEKYLKWCELNNALAQSTLRAYRYTHKLLRAFCDGLRVTAVEDVTHELMLDFIGSLGALAPNSRAMHYQNVKTFFNFLIKQVRMIKESPMIFSAPKKPVGGSHRPLTPAEQSRMLKATEQSANAPLDRALILTLLATGLRSVDVRKLRRSNIDFAGHVVRVIPQKTQRTRRKVTIPNVPAMFLDAIRALPRSIDDSPLFGPLTENRLIRIVARTAARAGVDATAHDFRCTFAVERLKEGASIYDVSKLLGHSNVTITERYYVEWIEALDARLVNTMAKADFSHLEKAG
jgi:integrase